MSIQIFETYEEARDFAENYSKQYNLSYIPEDIKLDIISDALSNTIWGLLAKNIDYASSDVMNAMNKFVGEELLSYLEWKVKNEQEQKVIKAQEYQTLTE